MAAILQLYLKDDDEVTQGVNNYSLGVGKLHYASAKTRKKRRPQRLDQKKGEDRKSAETLPNN